MLRALGVRSRLAIALVALSLGLVALVTIFSGIAADRALNDFGRADLAMTARQTAAVAASLYRRDGGWSRATVTDLDRIAGIEGHEIAVRDQAGRPVTGDVRREPRDRATVPIMVGGRAVGTLVLGHYAGGFLRLASANSKPQRALSSELHQRLARTNALAGALAGVVAFVLALIAAVALTRPLRKLITMAGALERGDIEGVLAHEISGSPEHRRLGLTLQRAARAIQRQQQARRETISAVAHELRTPLVGIRGRIEASQDGLIPNIPRALDAMHRDVLRLVRLIEDVEQLTEAQQPGLLIARVQIDLADVADARATVLAPHFATAGIALDRELRPVRIDGDPERLGQIVDNLLSNALRYTDAGGSVCVRVYPDGNKAVLEVEDSGIGIAEDELANIFERFWRSDRSRSRATGGAGIGLALVQELVRGHDGEIEVTSTPGQGTSFRVTLPAARAPLDEPGLRYASLKDYSTPAGQPLVFACVDQDQWEGSASVLEDGLRRRIRTGEPVIILQVDAWPDVGSYEAIDGLTRLHGEARARGGTLILLAETNATLGALARAGAHHTVPVVSTMDQALEELKDLGLLSSVTHIPGLAAADG